MVQKTTYRMPYRRRRELKTDYKQRIALLKSGKPRLVVRKTNKYIIAQIVVSKEAQDYTVIGITSKILQKYGWKYSFKNLPACYLTGLIIGKLALKNGINEAVLDIGLNRVTKGNRIFTVLKGAVDAGLKIPHSKEILPSEDRIKGLHIANYLEKFKNLPNDFEKIKEKILKEYGS
ncbi:MAG: 50S ribosomal protein L18 [Candidatus Aenigmatarchaeota archaeon]